MRWPQNYAASPCIFWIFDLWTAQQGTAGGEYKKHLMTFCGEWGNCIEWGVLVHATERVNTHSKRKKNGLVEKADRQTFTRGVGCRAKLPDGAGYTDGRTFFFAFHSSYIDPPPPPYSWFEQERGKGEGRGTLVCVCVCLRFYLVCIGIGASEHGLVGWLVVANHVQCMSIRTL